MTPLKAIESLVLLNEANNLCNDMSSCGAIRDCNNCIFSSSEVDENLEIIRKALSKREMVDE